MDELNPLLEQRVLNARNRLNALGSEEEAALTARIEAAMSALPVEDPQARIAIVDRISNAIVVYWYVLAEASGDANARVARVAVLANDLTKALAALPASLLSQSASHDRKWMLRIIAVDDDLRASEREDLGDDDMPKTDEMQVPHPLVPRFDHQRNTQLEMARHAVWRVAVWARASRRRYPPAGRGRPRELALHHLAGALATAFQDIARIEIGPRNTKRDAIFPALFQAIVAVADPHVTPQQIATTLEQQGKRRARHNRRLSGQK